MQSFHFQGNLKVALSGECKYHGPNYFIIPYKFFIIKQI